MTRLLVFTKTTGWRHDSIPAGIATMQELAKDHGFEVDATEDSAVFTLNNLATYQAVVFLNTSGDIFDDNQRAALRAYIDQGGGYVGVHGAADTEYHWPFYGQLVGAWARRHPKVQPATLHVHDRNHPATAHLDTTWVHTDEWYDFHALPDPQVRILLLVDESSYDGGQMGANHPIAWCHRIGDGRCFYTGLGHTIESYTDPRLRTHLLGGINYTIGRE